jgi:hypothetical protein
MSASCAKQPIVCSFHAGKLCKRSFQSLGEFREENKFSTWLIRITVSQSLMKPGNQRATKHTLINKSDGSAPGGGLTFMGATRLPSAPMATSLARLSALYFW